MASTKNLVHQLKDNTFKCFLETHKLVLVAFEYSALYEPNERLSMALQQAAAVLSTAGVQFATIDCAQEEAVFSQFEFGRFPQVNLFESSKITGQYRGPWTSSELISYTRRKFLPICSSIDAASLEAFKSTTKILVVGYFDTNDTDSRECFESVAEHHDLNYVFGICTDETLAAKEGVQMPSIILYRNDDNEKELFRETHNSDAVALFMKSAGTPLLPTFWPEVYGDYYMGEIPLGYIFLDNQSPTARSQLEEIFLPLARKYRGRMQFGFVRHDTSDHIADHIDLETSDKGSWPAFAINDLGKNVRYFFDKAGQALPTQQEISEYVDRFFKGEVKRDVRSELAIDELDKGFRRLKAGEAKSKAKQDITSEPVPNEPQPGPVQTIVGHTFKSLVLDSEKDVFVDFYTQWCGPCKVMAPQWEKLARLYSEDAEGSQKVLIGKIDAEANDVPDYVRGFPWLVLYPAGQKDEPIQYVGNRMVEPMANFVRDMGTHRVDITKTRGQVKEA